LASLQKGPIRITVDEAAAYWTTYDDGAVMSCAIGGCGGDPTTLASTQPGLYGVAVDSSGVYWTTGIGESRTLVTCAKSGCGASPTELASFTDSSGALTVDSSSVYWTTVTAVMKCPTSGCTRPTTVASAPDAAHVSAIAVDEASVYWVDGNAGTVMRLALK
jgi:hypothetical protein